MNSSENEEEMLSKKSKELKEIYKKYLPAVKSLFNTVMGELSPCFDEFNENDAFSPMRAFGFLISILIEMFSKEYSLNFREDLKLVKGLCSLLSQNLFNLYQIPNEMHDSIMSEIIHQMMATNSRISAFLKSESEEAIKDKAVH